MAFNANYFALANHTSNGYPRVWDYKTADSLATCDTADYFLNAYSYGLRAGDEVRVYVVTNLGASNEAYSAVGTMFCNAASSSAVDMADSVNKAGTDTD